MILAAETADLDRSGSVVLKDAGVVFGSRASTNATSLLVHLSTLHFEALLSSHAEICGQKGAGLQSHPQVTKEAVKFSK